jgi:hypothetical protein
LRYEQLRADRLVWIGIPDGSAHARHPLPLSLAATNCSFRPAVEAALAADGRAWTVVLDSQGTETTLAAIRADLAVGVWLESIVPEGLQVLSDTSLLPLPTFSIGLGLPAKYAPLPAALALARELRSAARHNVGPAGVSDYRLFPRPIVRRDTALLDLRRKNEEFLMRNEDLPAASEATELKRSSVTREVVRGEPPIVQRARHQHAGTAQ